MEGSNYNYQNGYILVRLMKNGRLANRVPYNRGDISFGSLAGKKPMKIL